MHASHQVYSIMSQIFSTFRQVSLKKSNQPSPTSIRQVLVVKRLNLLIGAAAIIVRTFCNQVQ